MKRTRQGFGLIEVLAAVTVLAVLLSFLVQMMSIAGQQRRLVEETRVLSESVTNMMGRAMALSFEEVTVETLEQLSESQRIGGNYEWNLRVESTERIPRGKRILIGLRRRQLGKGSGPEAKLVAWKYDLVGLSPKASGR